jgi:GNAT superfamily N-acetyltransferase
VGREPVELGIGRGGRGRDKRHEGEREDERDGARYGQTVAIDTGAYEISTDPARLDLDLIHRYLSEESYWARGRSRGEIERAIEHSIPFGAYRDGLQAGFARVVSDRATFAWLADVFVLPSHRGQGVGKRLVQTVLEHPELRPMRRWLLATADAHGLYRRFGFDSLQGAGRFMAIESPADARDCAEG